MERIAAEAAIGNVEACLARAAYGQSLRGRGKHTMSNSPSLHPVLLDVVGLFERLEIRYALIGGLAAMFYGQPRFTEDVDLVAASGHRELLAAHPEAMREFHFDPTCNYKLYHESGVDVDLWKDEHADGIVARAVEAKVAGRALKIAEVHDLVAMKLRAGRLRDDADIGAIVKHQRLDEDLLETYVTAAEFRRFREIVRRAEAE